MKAGVADIRGGIDLTREDLRSLARRRIELDGHGDRPFGMYCFGSDEPEAELARAVERRVFDDAFGNSPEVMEVEYTPYEPCSLFTCILDHRRMLPVASCRMIMPGGLGWKSLDDIGRIWGVSGPILLRRQGLAPDPGRVWDCATLAVEPSYRKTFIVQAIMGTIGLVATEADAELIIGIVDCKVLRIAQQLCGRPWSTFDGIEPRCYLDSPASVPVWLSTATVSEQLSRHSPEAFRVMTDPTSFEPAIAGWEAGAVRSVVRRLSPLIATSAQTR